MTRTATIEIKAENLSVGDTILAPFGNTATVDKIKPFGPKATFVSFHTEHGWTRLTREHTLICECKVVG